MSTLTRFATHCRAMTTAEHTDECAERLAKWEAQERIRASFRRMLDGTEILDPGPRPTCDGCVTDADRKWWAALADEIDHHLAGQVDLFGQISNEPTEDEA